MWVLTVVLVGALLITLTAIVVDSPIGRSIARRFDLPGDGAANPDVKQLERKVAALEDELDELNRSVTGLRDEVQFMQRLLEDPTRKKPS